MSDLISRQDAIEKIKKHYDLLEGATMQSDVARRDELSAIMAMLFNLPSADAVEVVQCKDCKWHLNGHLCKQLSQYGSIETPPSFYCGFGERREP